MDSIITFDMVLPVIIPLLLLSAIMLFVYYVKRLTYKTSKSTAIVRKKEYAEPHSTTRLMPVGKTLIPSTTHHDTEYNVYVEYKGKSYCIDNEHLYNKVCINDVIPVIVEKGLNKRGEAEYVKVKIDQTFIN